MARRRLFSSWMRRLCGDEVMATIDRAVGALAGLASGDAVGTTLEFRRPGSFEPITDMVGGGPFHLRAGELTDDTSMAPCLPESIVDRDGLTRSIRCVGTSCGRMRGTCRPTDGASTSGRRPGPSSSASLEQGCRSMTSSTRSRPRRFVDGASAGPDPLSYHLERWRR